MRLFTAASDPNCFCWSIELFWLHRLFLTSCVTYYLVLLTSVCCHSVKYSSGWPARIVQVSRKHTARVTFLHFAITLCLVTPLPPFFFLLQIVSCPSKQCLWSIPPMLIAMAPLMMRQQTRPGRNISSARSQQTRSHLSLCSLGGSQALTLLWPRGRENGSSIWFRETQANAVISKQNNTSFVSRHLCR